VVFVADDLAAWVVGLLADAGRRRLTTWVLGSDQERELRSAATAAVKLTAADLRPEGGERAEELAMIVGQVFTAPVPDTLPAERGMLLEVLQAGIAGQLALLGDPSLTGAGESSAAVLEVQATTLADTLFSHLVGEIVIRGARGGPLAPFAAQLNNDMTHLQGQRLEVVVGRLAEEVREALARLDVVQAAGPVALAQLPASLAVPPGPLEDLKRFLYGLYARAGSPDIKKIVDTISANLYQDLPLPLSLAAVNDCINSPDLPGWETTLSVGGALITVAMDRPHASASPGGGQPDHLPGRSGQRAALSAHVGLSTPQRPAGGAKRLGELFGFWKAAAWDAAVNDRFGGDPRSWHTLVVARLDELGVAAARSTVDKWRNSAPIDTTWLSWIDSLIQLTSEGSLRPVTRRALPTAGGGPFLGREQQAAELNDFLDRVQQGRGGLALILGPAGMGKSRLLVEVLAERVSDARAEWVAFDRGEAGYRGWRRLLGPLWITLRRTELAPAELIAHIETLDDILLAATGSTGRPLSGEVAEAIAALLDHVAARQPLVLVIDDAHRGGTSSDHLLIDVARRVSAGTVGIIAALRPDELEADSPIRDYADQAGGRSALDIVVPVQLPPLDREAAAGILRERTGVELSPEIVGQVLRQTAGCPQLILNSIQASASGARPSLSAAGKLGIEGLRVLEPTLQSRPAEVRAVLEAAAVSAVSGSIEPDTVARVAELPVNVVERILDEERHRGSILTPQTSGYGFQHDNWIDALASCCPPARRHELHARCLALLRKDPAADPQRLAQHAIGAGVPLIDPKELVGFAWKAADLAVADYAFGAAVELYEVAVRYATGKERIDLLIDRSDALRFHGRWDDARSALKLAASQARALGMPGLEAVSLIHLERLTWSFGLGAKDVIGQIRGVIDRLPPGEGVLRTQLQAALAMRLCFAARQYENEQADLARTALLQLPQINDPVARADIIVGIRAGLQDGAAPDELLDFDRQLLELGIKIHSPYHIGEALVVRIVDLIRGGRLLELQSAVRAHREFAEQNPAPFVAYLQATVDAMISLAGADFSTAEAHTAEAAGLSESWGGWAADETVRAQAGWLLYETGKFEGLTEFLEGLPEQDVTPLNEPEWSLAAGLIHAEKGDAERASRLLRDVCMNTGDLGNLPRGPARIGILATAAMLLGHPALRNAFPPDEASRWGSKVSDLLAAHQDTHVLAGWPAVMLGSKHRYIGLAYLAAQQPGKAATHLARAVEENREFAALHIRTRFDLARALLRQPIGHSEAMAEMERIQQNATTLGMAGLAAQAAIER
jgi:tetratricopeptide (TPR) repeat protein